MNTTKIKLSKALGFNAYKLMAGERCKIMDDLIKQMIKDKVDELNVHIPNGGYYVIRKFTTKPDYPFVKYFDYIIVGKKWLDEERNMGQTVGKV